MNDTTIMDAVAIGRTFSEQLAYISSNPPTAGGLIYLLPPCLVLIAIDVASRLSQRPKIAAEVAQSEQVKHLVGRVQDALARFQALEKKLSNEKARSQQLVHMLRKQQNFTLHRQRLSALKTLAEKEESLKKITDGTARAKKIAEVRDPFHNFCERLILQNRIWAQQREGKRLRKSLATMRESSCSNAFQAFCDRLLLSNRIWAQQKEVEQLVGEAEKLKRAREAAVTNAAKQMVLDVEKDRMIEDFVQELIAEVEKCRSEVIAIQSDHEQEVMELTEEWRKECRKLAKEVRLLELSRDAHLVEQSLSNEHETHFLERLPPIGHKPPALDLRPAELPDLPEEVSGANEADDAETLSGSDMERMSNMSTSTCVASAGDRTPNEKASFDPSPRRRTLLNKQKPVPLPPLKMITRRQSMSIILSPSTSSSAGTSSPAPRVEVGPYAGFSFNPLFFGSPNSQPEEVSDHSSSRRMRTYSLQSTLSSRSGAGSRIGKTNEGREQAKRAQWKF